MPATEEGSGPADLKPAAPAAPPAPSQEAPAGAVRPGRPARFIAVDPVTGARYAGVGLVVEVGAVVRVVPLSSFTVDVAPGDVEPVEG